MGRLPNRAQRPAKNRVEPKAVEEAVESLGYKPHVSLWEGQA